MKSQTPETAIELLAGLFPSMNPVMVHEWTAILSKYPETGACAAIREYYDTFIHNGILNATALHNCLRARMPKLSPQDRGAPPGWTKAWPPRPMSQQEYEDEVQRRAMRDTSDDQRAYKAWARMMKLKIEARDFAAGVHSGQATVPPAASSVPTPLADLF